MTLFKAMTWNVENLFMPNPDSGPETVTDLQEKIQNIVAVIQSQAPHVVAFQEIGSEQAFNLLHVSLETEYPHKLLSRFPDGRGIRVGFFSTLPIEESEDISNFPHDGLVSVPARLDASGNVTLLTRKGRGGLRIQLTLENGLKVHLITVHLKSKLLTFVRRSGDTAFFPRDENERCKVAGLALILRAAEAAAIRVAVTRLLENNESDGVIVLGDLNDVENAATTQILLGPPGSEIGTRAFLIPDTGDKDRLWNLAAQIPEARRFSRIFKGNKELIDHILVSQQMLPDRNNLPAVDSLVDFASVLPDIAALPSITEDPRQRRGKPASDHSPVIAAFEL